MVVDFEGLEGNLLGGIGPFQVLSALLRCFGWDIHHHFWGQDKVVGLLHGAIHTVTRLEYVVGLKNKGWWYQIGF